jgi:hypothetical protein
MWKTLHAVSFNYPEKPTDEERKNYIDFFRSLAKVIPCPSCGVHFDEFLNENPIQATDRESLSKWVYEAHANVNKMSNKPNPPYEEVRKMYSEWDKGTVKRFKDMPKKKREVYLSDPHLDLSTDKGIFAPAMMTGESAQSTLIPVIVVLIIILAALYAMKRLKKR